MSMRGAIRIDAEMAEWIDRSILVVGPSYHVNRRRVPVVRYATRQELASAGAGVGVQRRVGPAMRLVLERLADPLCNQNPMMVDGVLIRAWSIPVAFFENALAPDSGYTIVVDLNAVEQLVRRRLDRPAPTRGDTLCPIIAWSGVVLIYATILVAASRLRCT
jgi:hypothetical protein